MIAAVQDRVDEAGLVALPVGRQGNGRGKHRPGKTLAFQRFPDTFILQSGRIPTHHDRVSAMEMIAVGARQIADQDLAGGLVLCRAFGETRKLLQDRQGSELEGI